MILCGMCQRRSAVNTSAVALRSFRFRWQLSASVWGATLAELSRFYASDRGCVLQKQLFLGKPGAGPFDFWKGGGWRNPSRTAHKGVSSSRLFSRWHRSVLFPYPMRATYILHVICDDKHHLFTVRKYNQLSMVSLNHRSIQIFTDGSAIDNPGGRGGIAVVVRYPDHLQLPDEVICELGYVESTNNRMELLACIKALEWVRKHKPWTDVTSIQIVTDSKYVADNVGYRAWGWKKNKWRNRYGEPKENSDLWKKLLSARQKAGIHVEFVQTKGKRSEILRKVDDTAKKARDTGVEVDRGYQPGSVSRSMVKGAAKRFPARGQVALIRPYRKKIMRTGEEKVRFDTLSDDGQTYVASFYAFATSAIAAELHRQNGYKVKFNDDPNYPQIVEYLEQVALPTNSSTVKNP